MPIELITLIQPIATAAIAGGIFALVGYFKNKKQDEAFEGFNTKEFVVTVVGGAAISGIASYMGITPDAVSATFIGPFVYQLLRKALKM